MLIFFAWILTFQVYTTDTYATLFDERKWNIITFTVILSGLLYQIQLYCAGFYVTVSTHFKKIICREPYA